MKKMALLFSFCSFFSFTSAVFAVPSLYVEDTTEYSAYYTRAQAGDALRSFNGCTNQVIGSIVFEDCSAKVKVPASTDAGADYLPPENDKDMRCHFEYQSYNPAFFKILVTSCL
jgi:hypothetical protein